MCKLTLMSFQMLHIFGQLIHLQFQTSIVNSPYTPSFVDQYHMFGVEEIGTVFIEPNFFFGEIGFSGKGVDF